MQKILGNSRIFCNIPEGSIKIKKIPQFLNNLQKDRQFPNAEDFSMKSDIVKPIRIVDFYQKFGMAAQ